MIDPKILKLKPDKIRLIGDDGKQVGVFNLTEAAKIAEEKDLDLILINEKQRPVIVRLGDYGAFVYQKEKKQRTFQKKQKETKEIRLSFREAEYDLKRKVEMAKEFLEKGHQLQIRLILKGRENLFPDLAEEKLKNFLNSLSDLIKFKITQPIKRISNFYFVVISKA